LISRFGRAGEDLRAKLRRDPLNRAAHPSATFGALRGGVSGDASVGMRGIAAERRVRPPKSSTNIASAAAAMAARRSPKAAS